MVSRSVCAKAKGKGEEMGGEGGGVLLHIKSASLGS